MTNQSHDVKNYDRIRLQVADKNGRIKTVVGLCGGVFKDELNVLELPHRARSRFPWNKIVTLEVIR